MARPVSAMSRTVRVIGSSISFLGTARAIPTWKGVVAYVLSIVLVYIKVFDSINTNPATLPNIIILPLVLQPGLSVGETLLNCGLCVCGILLGTLNFFILGHLGHVIPAQAIVLAIMAFPLAQIKAISLRYFVFSLVCLLMSFFGIVSTVNNGGNYDPTWLKGITETYLWSVVVVLVVNLVVLPYSAEGQLRKGLVASLDHARSFVHLMNKAYLTELTEDEKASWGQLVEIFRADMGNLNRAMVGTRCEISWSRWELEDYERLLALVNSMHGAMRAFFSGLLQAQENQSLDVVKTRFLPNSAVEFQRGGRNILLTIEAIMKDLSSGLLTLKVPESHGFPDIERQDALGPNQAGSDSKDALEAAVIGSAPTAVPGIRLTDMRLSDKKAAESTDAVDRLERDYDAISAKQLELAAMTLQSGLTDAFSPGAWLSSGAYIPRDAMASKGDATGATHELKPRRAISSQTLLKPSRADKSQDQRATSSRTLGLPGKTEGSKSLRMMSSWTSAQSGSGDEDDDYEDEAQGNRESESSIVATQAAVQVYSLLFSMNRLASELRQLHSTVTQTKEGIKRRRRLHIRVFQLFQIVFGAVKEDRRIGRLSVPAAMAALEGRQYVPQKTSLWTRILALDQWFRAAPRVYGFRVAVAFVTYASFVWAPVITPFFTTYGMTGPIIDLVLALPPTFGEGMISLSVQVTANVVGFVYAMIVLLIFKGVGGFGFNPYGVVCLCGLFAIPFQYLIHEMPMYHFILSILTLNFTGVLVCTVYLTAVNEGAALPMMTLLTGEVIAGVSIALVLAFLFHLLFLRNSAKRTIRIALARLVQTQLDYVTMLQVYCHAMHPIDSGESLPQSALARVERELRRKEGDIQGQIEKVNLLTLYATVEPRWDQPLSSQVVQHLVQANQALLDRFIDARVAIGSEPFKLFVLREFSSVLLPYPRQWRVGVSTSLYLSASSIASNIPMPASAPKIGTLAKDTVRDALLWSARFAKTEEGQASIKGGEFMRYWFFILAITEATKQIDGIEKACMEGGTS